MDASFCVEALDDALTDWVPDIFNTDQGSQFTSTDFIDKLELNRIRPTCSVIAEIRAS